MIRQIMEKLRSGVRALTGAQEDRASLWSGIQLLQEEIKTLRKEVEEVGLAVDMGRILQGRSLAVQNNLLPLPASIQEMEFKVFSQFGDDGIIQYLINHLKLRESSFIEFGVGAYRECNTRFLLVNNNWRGLIIEGSHDDVEKIRKDPVSVFHDLTAVNTFITRDNINDIFKNNGFSGPIGLLSVDIDGNDYWVWEAITAVEPALVVCEYNSVFGPDRALTVPYDPAFVRGRAHYSNLYYGASLKALCLLAQSKGYAFIGSNSNGNNAYFVKQERLGGLREMRAEEGWVESRFRESRDSAGRVSFISGSDRLKVIAGCQVCDLEKNDMVTF